MPCKAAYLSKITAGFPLTLWVMEDNCCYACLSLCPHIQMDLLLAVLSTATVWTGTLKQSVFTYFLMNVTGCGTFAWACLHIFAWRNQLPIKCKQSSGYAAAWCENSWIWSERHSKYESGKQPTAGHFFRSWTSINPQPLFQTFIHWGQLLALYLLSHTFKWLTVW